MASWVKTPSNRYINIGQIQNAYAVGDNISGQILGVVGDLQAVVLKDGFSSLAAAQTALDNAIVNLGGAI